MEKLEATNIVLRSVNEEAIGDLETEAYIVAQVDPLLESHRKRVLDAGPWQFNSDTQTLSANDDGKIVLPSGTREVLVPNSERSKLTWRGGFLWNRIDQTFHSEDIEVQIVLDTEFEDLSEKFATWVCRSAAVDFDAQVHNGSLFGHLRDLEIDARQVAINSEVVMFESMFGWGEIDGAYRGAYR